MKYCAICHAELSQDAEHGVLLVGRLGTSYEICSGCENVMDGVFSEDDSVRTNAKAELYRMVHKNEHIHHNAELLGYFAGILESDGRLPAEEADDIIVEDDEETLSVEEGERLFEFNKGFTLKSLRKVRDRVFFGRLPMGIILALIFAVPITAWFVSSVAGTFRIIGLIVLWILFGMLSFSLMPAHVKDSELYCPSTFIIEGNIIVAKSEKFYQERHLDDVKKVLDFGEFYQFVFCRHRKSEAFFCAKEGIIIGDIDAFEKLFEGKIVRKRKSDS